MTRRHCLHCHSHAVRVALLLAAQLATMACGAHGLKSPTGDVSGAGENGSDGGGVTATRSAVRPRSDAGTLTASPEAAPTPADCDAWVQRDALEVFEWDISLSTPNLSLTRAANNDEVHSDPSEPSALSVTTSERCDAAEVLKLALDGQKQRYRAVTACVRAGDGRAIVEADGASHLVWLKDGRELTSIAAGGASPARWGSIEQGLMLRWGDGMLVLLDTIRGAMRWRLVIDDVTDVLPVGRDNMGWSMLVVGASGYVLVHEGQVPGARHPLLRPCAAMTLPFPGEPTLMRASFDRARVVW